MRHVNQKYHDRIRRANAVERCLQKARERWPGEELSYCGNETNWEDCLIALRTHAGIVRVYLQYNIGKNSHAETVTV
jgi:hypothetical protein